MLLRHSLGLVREAAALENAANEALRTGNRSADIAAPGARTLGTREVGDAVLARLSEQAP